MPTVYHVRKQIRDAAKTALTGLTTTGARVYATRPDEQPLQSSELPGLRVFTKDETVEVITTGPLRRRERLLELVVEACVRETSGYDDDVDLIAKEVETALDADVSLGGLCQDIKPVSFSLEVDAAGEQPVAVGRMTFQVRYYTEKGTPGVAA